MSVAHLRSPKLNLKSAESVRAFFAREDGTPDEWIPFAPELATAVLEYCMGPNRSVSDHRVSGYAADMASGNWRRTHQGIAFSAAGTLLDGQHRLWAISQAGVTVEMKVAFGLDADAINSIDQMRVRSVKDAFQIGGKGNASRLVATVRALALLIGEGPLRTVDQVQGFQAQYADGIDWAMGLHAKVPAAARGAFAFARKTEPARVEAFAERMSSGVGFDSKNDPARLLRVLLFENGGSATASAGRRLKANPVSVGTKTLRAIAAGLVGEQLAVLQEGNEIVVYFARAHGLERVNGAPMPKARTHLERRLAALGRGERA